MRLDAFLLALHIGDAGRVAGELETAGFHGVWVAETRVDPFLPLAVAATGTRTLRLGTGIAVALARDPVVIARDAWAIQQASGGRFDLGLGTQVRAHVERRFSMPYEHPRARLREYVAALRHLWDSFSRQEPARFQGDFYSIEGVAPPVAAARMDRISVHVAAVNERMFQLAGEVADGVIAHAFATPSYLRTIAIPALARGLARSGRSRAAFQVFAPVFTVVEESATFARDERYAREQIAFYGATAAYQSVLASEGLSRLGDELVDRAHARRYGELPDLVTADVVERFVTRAPTYAALGARLRERYEGLADRIALYGAAAEIGPHHVEQLAGELTK